MAITRQVVAGLLISCWSLSSFAEASPQDHKAFGHRFNTKSDEQNMVETLHVDGAKLHENALIDIHSLAEVDGGVIAVGSTSAGGNACDADPFIVFAAPKKKPTLIGPVSFCRASLWSISGNTVRLWTPPLPGMDGESWEWTVGGQLKKLGATKHQPKANWGWDEFKTAKDVAYTIDLFDYQPVSEALYAILGSDASYLIPDLLAVQVGSEHRNGVFVGETCMAHACSTAGTLIAVDANSRQVFVAWKGQDSDFQFRPEVNKWPDQLRSRIQKWKLKFQD
jgi:hypothetical protein